MLVFFFIYLQDSCHEIWLDFLLLAVNLTQTFLLNLSLGSTAKTQAGLKGQPNARGSRHCRVWGGLDVPNLTLQADGLFPPFKPNLQVATEKLYHCTRLILVLTSFSWLHQGPPSCLPFFPLQERIIEEKLRQERNVSENQVSFMLER